MSDNHGEEYNQEQVEKSERDSKFYEQTMAMLQTEERFVNFFKSYNKQSVESFIKYYAERKTDWYANADSHYRYRISKQNKWRNAALNMLKEIFLKKLFNLKCRWLAGEMDLPGIEISNDFAKWENDPSSCNAIEPITQEEFDCYIDFLQDEIQQKDDEDDADERGSSYSALEFYHEHKSLFVDGYEEFIPRWFHHYDARFGTAPLLDLSIIRMDLEVDYHDIYSEEVYKKTLTPEQQKTFYNLSRLQRKELHENPEKEKAYIEERNREWEEEQKTKPQYISLCTYDRKIMNELVALIEPSEIKAFYKADREWRDRHSSQEMIDVMLISLKEAKEYIPVESDDDYRNAIKNAYANYAYKMEMETLPVIFDEYCECIHQGKPFDWKIDNGYTSSTPHKDDSGNRILAARKWKGEPENFDFLKKENLPKP